MKNTITQKILAIAEKADSNTVYVGSSCGAYFVYYPATFGKISAKTVIHGNTACHRITFKTFQEFAYNPNSKVKNA